MHEASPFRAPAGHERWGCAHACRLRQARKGVTELGGDSMGPRDDETCEAARSTHPLDQLEGLSAEAVASLRGRWIETAEQLVALAASEDGRAGLKELLDLDDDALGELVARAKALVGSEGTARLSQATPGGTLGVVLTDEQKRLHRHRDAAADDGGHEPDPGDEAGTGAGAERAE